VNKVKVLRFPVKVLKLFDHINTVEATYYDQFGPRAF